MYIAGSSISGWYILKDQPYSGHNYLTMSMDKFETWYNENKNKIEKCNFVPV